MMKNISRYILSAAALLCAAACSREEVTPLVQQSSFRQITVGSVLTRTTIDYEGSDVSHLVWNPGDEVAYVTDVQGDVFKTATVSNNAFQASVPASAGSANTLVVLWPAGGNQGKSLGEAALSLAGGELSYNVEQDFDGSMLPMYAKASVPSGNSVDVDYHPLASVVRFSVVPLAEEVGAESDEEPETLVSVSLSANEALFGEYTVDPASEGGFRFTGAAGHANDVKVVLQGAPESLDVTNPSLYIHVAVNRGAYTGVNVTVETNKAKYAFKGGKMELDKDKVTLYRVALDLNKAKVETDGDGGSGEDPDVPVITDPYYAPVTATEALVEGGKYLIVTADAPYHLVTKSTKEFNLNGLDYAEVTLDEEGHILPSKDVDKWVWNIYERSDSFSSGYYFWSVGNDKCLNIAPNITPSSDKNYCGQTYMDTESASQSWGDWLYPVSFDADGTAHIGCRDKHGNNMSSVELFCFKKGSNELFCFGYPDRAADCGTVRPLKIFKLFE